MKKILLLILFIAFAGSNSFGQFKKHAHWKASFSEKEVKQGGQVDIIFDVSIDDGWYMYSSDIAEDIGPLPTTVVFEESDAFKPVGSLRPVKPKKKYDDIWKADITYFTGKAQFRQTIKVLKPGLLVKGTADFQTCTIDNGVCVPGSTDFQLSGLMVSEGPAAPEVQPAGENKQAVSPESVPVVRDSSRSGAAQAEVIEPAADIRAGASIREGDLQPAKKKAVPDEDQSLWAFAATAFAAGLLALLTPCVFPVIPMTVTFFTKQKEGKKKALLYGIFIIMIYTLIGVVVSRINGPAFANFLSTHWVPNLAFFLIFFLFGLSFLGMFEIIIPTSFVNKMDARADQGGGLPVCFLWHLHWCLFHFPVQDL